MLAAIDGDDIATGERQPPNGPVQLRDFNKLKKQVAAIIYSSISPIIHPHVMACRTELAEMLRKLANQYDTTLNLASASRQKQLFHQEEMKKEDTISSFTARLLQYNIELAHTVLRITPEDIVLKLLDSLPD